MYRLGIVVLALLALAACGGGGSSSNDGGRGGNDNGGTSGPVAVTSGTTVSGIDITLPAPTASPAPNAQFLGAGIVGQSFFLTNGSAVVHRGQSAAIGIQGDGLSTSVTVTFSGPNDITIDTTTIQPLSSGKPGLKFLANISPAAALGARTVFLRNAQGDITAYAGGLEVMP